MVSRGWAKPVTIIRSYQGESTGSHPNSEVKHPWACSVLRWGTTWESQVMYVLPFWIPKGLLGATKSDTFSIFACHPCAGAMLIFSVSFQFLRMTPKSSEVCNANPT